MNCIPGYMIRVNTKFMDDVYVHNERPALDKRSAS